MPASSMPQYSNNCWIMQSPSDCCGQPLAAVTVREWLAIARMTGRLSAALAGGLSFRAVGAGLFILSAAGISMGRGRSKATGGTLTENERTAANAGFRQFQFHSLGRALVACDVRHNGAHLLIARHHQEGRRAAVGFHAGDVET